MSQPVDLELWLSLSSLPPNEAMVPLVLKDMIVVDLPKGGARSGPVSEA